MIWPFTAALVYVAFAVVLFRAVVKATGDRAVY